MIKILNEDKVDMLKENINIKETEEVVKNKEASMDYALNFPEWNLLPKNQLIIRVRRNA